MGIDLFVLRHLKRPESQKAGRLYMVGLLQWHPTSSSIQFTKSAISLSVFPPSPCLRLPPTHSLHLLPHLTSSHHSFLIDRTRIKMAGDEGVSESIVSRYEEAMTALSSLITKRVRGDNSNMGDRFDLLFEYLKILELEKPISNMKVIHVAGTKGKGSTCTFTESILRKCGFHTGLFTSPHLMDVRERFRLDGSDISKEKFLAHFWWCYDRLKERSTDDMPMPSYFHFLALLALKIFAAEQVDVAILEVGLGGRFDATNVVQAPIVCGIASLGYDHMEILGNTLGEIAGEKAGILKQGVPAFTVPQPDEAMHVLEAKASQLNVNLQVTPPLDVPLLNGLPLGLQGDHQYVNAGLAVALCSAWLQRTGHLDIPLPDKASLPEQFVQGLTAANLQGRAQIVTDQYINSENTGDLVFYLDGAHSPESMEVCARWFAHAIKEDDQQSSSLSHPPEDNAKGSHGLMRQFHQGTAKENSTQILLFNCMSVRDPQLLLPSLMKTCATHGVHFKQALFVPNISVYHKVTTNVPQVDSQVDLSWQLALQRVWENLTSGDRGGDVKDVEIISHEVKNEADKSVRHYTNSKVFPTLPLAIKWLRDSVQENRSLRFQVLVTGSLHLVGDVLRLIRK